ncbi:MAG: hypothetical protein PWR13_989 [Archaeoglobi archaeon]|nr:hypothetical protein [Archaeoglobi archaeon]
MKKRAYTYIKTPLTWDYVELNVFTGVMVTDGKWDSNLNWILRVLEHCTQV